LSSSKRILTGLMEEVPPCRLDALTVHVDQSQSSRKDSLSKLSL
jgi:hypothetical protein